VRENPKGELDMPMKRYKPEQIVNLLRQIEVEIANGKKPHRKPARKLRSLSRRTTAGGKNSAA
jgi:hypothetical protein